MPLKAVSPAPPKRMNRITSHNCSRSGLKLGSNRSEALPGCGFSRFNIHGIKTYKALLTMKA